MDADLATLLLNLCLAGVMVAMTRAVSFLGPAAAHARGQRRRGRLRAHEHHGSAALLTLLGVFGVFGLHTVEIWLYAVLYRLLGETGSFADALYFSTTTFASLGLGDIVLSPRWRLISSIEAANGVILFAWSTAFLITLTRRLRLFDHGWLERGE